MFFKEDTTFNDIRDKSLQQWLDEMEQHEDVAVRGGVKLTREYVQYLKDEITELCDVCGLIVEKKEEILDSDIEALIAERQAARKAKDFARADAIRDELLEKGIILKDTREGVQWKKA